MSAAACPAPAIGVHVARLWWEVARACDGSMKLEPSALQQAG
ncbi:MAG: hypothetical protein ACRC0L_07905 [Angustibacter sp.]